MYYKWNLGGYIMINNLKFVKIYQKVDSKKLDNIPEIISKEFEKIQLDQKIMPRN